jgi:SAM-dependent methyltransferase
VSTRLEKLTDSHQFDLKPTGDGAVLDVGCGSAKYPGAVGIDISGDTAADVVHDLDTFPWPLQDSSFDHILLQDVIEHLAEPYKVMEELHRIARPGARIQMRTPHFSSVLAYSDPTHRHALSALGMRALAEPNYGHYTAVRFKLVSVGLDFWGLWRVLGIAAVANRAIDLYEKYFAFWFPAMNVRAEYEVLK